VQEHAKNQNTSSSLDLSSTKIPNQQSKIRKLKEPPPSAQKYKKTNQAATTTNNKASFFKTSNSNPYLISHHFGNTTKQSKKTNFQTLTTEPLATQTPN
jgi:hypothetical protein